MRSVAFFKERLGPNSESLGELTPPFWFVYHHQVRKCRKLINLDFLRGSLSIDVFLLLSGVMSYHTGFSREFSNQRVENRPVFAPPKELRTSNRNTSFISQAPMDIRADENSIHMHSSLQTTSEHQALSRNVFMHGGSRRTGPRWNPKQNQPPHPNRQFPLRSHHVSMSSVVASIRDDGQRALPNGQRALPGSIHARHGPNSGSIADFRNVALATNDIVFSETERRRQSALPALPPEYLALARSLTESFPSRRSRFPLSSSPRF